MLHSSLAAFFFFLQINQNDSFFEVYYTARALNIHITLHRITAVFIMKTTRGVFMIMRAGKIDKRYHKIAKKIKFYQFVNNTSHVTSFYVRNAFKINKKQL